MKNSELRTVLHSSAIGLVRTRPGRCVMVLPLRWPATGRPAHAFQSKNYFCYPAGRRLAPDGETSCSQKGLPRVPQRLPRFRRIAPMPVRGRASPATLSFY